jgi:pSer/pThr/pTyr-binding forkhead associated (FHA) protein
MKILAIEVMNGPMDGLRFVFPRSGVMTIGRHPENDVALPLDPYVSRRHAKIICEDGKYLLEDTNSTNGTWMDDKKVSRVKVPVGATFKVGNTYLKLKKIPEDEFIGNAIDIIQRVEKYFLGLKEDMPDEEWKKLCRTLKVIIDDLSKESPEEVSDPLQRILDIINKELPEEPAIKGPIGPIKPSGEPRVDSIINSLVNLSNEFKKIKGNASEDENN